MRHCLLFVLLLPTGHLVAQDALTAPTLTAAECEVWARELSFAQSVADHDAVAFASHLHPQAAFNSGAAAPLRGSETIAAAWADIVAGKGLKLSWYPSRVTIGGPRDVAWSSGPALFEHLAPDAPQRYSIGTFHSVWHKGADGVWRVLFDEGAGRKPAAAADARAFHAARRAACPQG